MEYIRSEERINGCVFCDAAACSTDSSGNLIVARNLYTFVIMNRYPYTSGHVMVLPYLHTSMLEELDEKVRSELIEMTNHAIVVLQRLYNPEGFNIGMNIGEAAGAGIEEHIHMHVVPRWSGDTNFMTSLGNTRVLPEEVVESYRQIRNQWSLDEF